MIATRTTPLSALFARIKAEMVALGVWYSSPADEAAMRMWLKTAWLDCGCNTDFAIFTQPADKLSIQFSVRVATSGHRVNVYWGDGSTDSVAPATESDTSLAKTYVTGALRPIIMLGRVTRFESVNTDGRTHFGGSITWLRSLTVLNWGGNNTGTGWGAVAASATGLCYMYHGGLTVLDAAEVNAILAGFWANRDAAKSRPDRYINIGKDTPTPNAAPTGQGLADKAALQAYRSPNNTGPDVWTVITN